MPDSPWYTETNHSIFVEPSKAFKLISSRNRRGPPHVQNAPKSTHSSTFPPLADSDAPAYPKDGGVDISLIRNLEEQARRSKSISCISALCLTMDTLGVQASLSRRLVRMARCAYGINLELDLRNTLRSFLGSRGIQEPTRRVRELGVLRDGRKVVVTGRCDALVRSFARGGPEAEYVVPVEIKSRTRVERLGGILRTGQILDAFKDEWSRNGDGSVSERKRGDEHAASGPGDATQSLLYMWLYGARRLLYIQCARIGQSDPIVPLIAEIPWDADAFDTLRSAILSSLEKPLKAAAPSVRNAPRSSDNIAQNPTNGSQEGRVKVPQKRDQDTQNSPVVSSTRVYHTRLLKKCGNILLRAGIATATNHRMNNKRKVSDMMSSDIAKLSVRTRKQRRAILRAAKLYGRQLCV